MLAKCASCSHVFNTDRYGLQYCPQCGAQLMLSPPPGAQPPGAPQGQPPAAGPTAPPAGSPPPASTALPGWTPPPPYGGPAGYDLPQDQPSPWEERHSRGVFPALIETIRKSMFEPAALFERMRVDNAAGAVSYFWIISAFSSVVSTIWALALLPLTNRLSSMPVLTPDNPLSRLPPEHPFSQLLHMQVQNTPGMIVSSMVGRMLFAPVILFVMAGILHVSAAIFGASKKGFNATLRALAYSSGPSVVVLVPLVGGLGAAIWWLVVFVVGLSKTQRCSTGSAIGAVVLPAVVFLCCGFMAVIVIAVSAAAAVGGLAHP